MRLSCEYGRVCCAEELRVNDRESQMLVVDVTCFTKLRQVKQADVGKLGSTGHCHVNFFQVAVVLNEYFFNTLLLHVALHKI